MKKTKNNGFTIAEAITTLAIASIVVLLTLGLILIINNIQNNQKNLAFLENEYSQATSEIDSFLNNYSIDGYGFEIAGDNVIKISKDLNEYSLTFDENAKKLTAQIYNFNTSQVSLVEKTFEKIIDITFTNQNGLIKCSFEFNNGTSLEKLFTFGV